MKRKMKGVVGIVLTLVLLASLTVGLAAPAGAAPGTLKFTTLTLPKVGAEGDWWAAPGSDVGPIAIAADGKTLFAGLLDDEEDWQLVKSSDGGYAWKMLDDFYDVADGSPIVDVAVSPDFADDLTVIVATRAFLYQSVDGGKRFVRMDRDWSPGEVIMDLDVALDGRGRLAIMVGTSTGVVLVTLETDVGTAEWSTDEAHSGRYSVYLSAARTGEYAELYFPVSIALGDIDLDTTSYWCYSTSGEYMPYLMFKLETGARINDDAPASADFTADWAEYTVSEGPDVWQWDDGTFASWADTVTEYGADTLVTGILIENSEITGSTTDVEAYVDDVTINGVTYYLEEDNPETPLVGVAIIIGGDVYVLSTATGMSWQPQEIDAYSVLACGFSPFFADDEGIGAVVTDIAKTRVRFAFAYVGEDDPGIGWNTDIGDAKVQDAEGHDFPSWQARMAFPDDFDAFGVGNNICFVGISAGEPYDPDHMLGDVYKVRLASTSSTTDLDIRGVLTTLLPTATNIVSIDVCGNAEEANIIVGTDYCSLTTAGYYFLVYCSTDGGETWIPSGTKSPTGGSDDYVVFEGAWTQVLMSPDYCTSGIAYTGTFGLGTSAFSRTKDSAATWDQVSLIDYGDIDDGYVVMDLDAAGYNAAGMLHMTTQVGGDLGAVWKRTGGKNWERIWSYANPGVTDAISELIITGETLFAVDYTATYIWRSSDNGATWPKKITTKEGLTEVCIVSPTTLYTGHGNGEIWWSTKSGTGWTKPEDSEIPSTTVIPYIGVQGDIVLVSSTDGMAFISSDGGETVKRVGITNPGGTDETVLATFDMGFATNNVIYGALAGVLGGGIWRCEVNLDSPGDSEWVQIDDIQDIEPYDYRDVIPSGPALALPPSGVLYVINAEAVGGVDGPNDPPDLTDGGLWRCTNPLADVDSVVPPYFEKENKGLADGDSVGLLDLDLFPTIIFCGVSNGVTPVDYWNQVVMFTDTLDSGVSLADPADKATGVGLLPAGDVKPLVTLAWKTMAGATSYRYQLAYDPDFASMVASDYTTSLVEGFELSPNKTYYWRVQVAAEDANENLIGAPLISPWSATWKFKTAIGAVMARPDLQAPDAGDIDVDISPTFEWSGIEWAVKYEFELATDPGTTAGGYFATPLKALTGTNALVSTAWKCDITLENSTRYYWHVKAIGVDTETPWSDVGTFTTMAKPVPPPAPVAPVEIPPAPAPITPAWIYAVIAIGAVLVIAVIVLIVTTRRVP